jgi:antiviral helicase SKI2
MADEEILDAILNPDPENGPILLERLGLGVAPSRGRVHQAIEEKLLLPQTRLPEHWLPAYQMCDGPIRPMISLS